MAWLQMLLWLYGEGGGEAVVVDEENERKGILCS